MRGDIEHGVEADHVPFLKEIEGHFMKKNLKGISFESPDHLLTTDFPCIRHESIRSSKEHQFGEKERILIRKMEPLAGWWRRCSNSFRTL